MRNMGKSWRAPKKTNTRAWKRIEAGDVWWERNTWMSSPHSPRVLWRPRLVKGRHVRGDVRLKNGVVAK